MRMSELWADMVARVNTGVSLGLLIFPILDDYKKWNGLV